MRELITVKMDRDQMLEYIKQFDGKRYGKDKEANVKEAINKIENLLGTFGFTLHSAPFDTGGFYRFELEKYHYIEVQTGYITEKSKPYGRSRKQYTNGYTGILRVHNHKVDLNPRTGEPWKIGDIKYSDDGCYSVTLTKRGWWSGD